MRKKRYFYSKKILELNGININKKTIDFDGKKIKTNEYLNLQTNFLNLSINNLSLKKSKNNLRIDLISHLFFINVFKFSKFGLILPCFVFLIISLISFSSGCFFQNKANFGFIEFNEIQIGFIMFVGVFCFLFFLIYLYFLIVKKEKVFYTKINGQNRLKHLSNYEYKKMMDFFDEKIDNFNNIFKKIETNRLIIRQFNESDIKDVYEFLKNENFCRYLNIKCSDNYDDSIVFVQKCMEDYHKNLFFKLAIELKEENKVIGFIGLSKMDLSKETCQVIYGINEAFWGKGIVKEALDEYLIYLKSLNYKYIFAGHVKENVNSGKVLVKCGFERHCIKDYVMNIKKESKNIVSYVYINDIGD